MDRYDKDVWLAVLSPTETRVQLGQSNSFNGLRREPKLTLRFA